MLKAWGNERNISQLVVGQLQVQNAGDVKHIFWDSTAGKLVVVEPQKCHFWQTFEVASWDLLNVVAIKEKLGGRRW